MKKLTLMGAAGALWGLSALLLSPMAHAVTYSDSGAAVVVYPKIVVGVSRDTVLTLTNESGTEVAAHCFYVNANSRCTNSGQPCTSALPDCFDAASGFTGACVTGWIEVNFDIVLTPRQPIAWSASEGLSNANVPCPGGLSMGPTCPRVCKGGINGGQSCTINAQCPGSSCASSSNAGTRVPPVGETPFIGELKCIQADPVTRLPKPCTTLDCAADPGACCRADLDGTAIITTVGNGGTQIDTERYNAVGLRPTGFNDGDRLLTIGGTPPDVNSTCLDLPPATRCEYEPCASVLVFNHLFDGAIDPISDSLVAHSELTLVPCTQDFLTQRIPQVTAQFLVYNEFEQRLSTSRLVNCLLNSPISQIDTSQPDRSIFSASLQGTVAGQTRITGVGGGLIGSATLELCDATGCAPPAPLPGGAAYNLNQFADREQADFIRIP
jgi:hypothetical protein